MEAKKSSSKQVVAILLLVIGLAAGVFGVLGLVGGGGMDPYEARNGVVYVQAVAYDDKGSSLISSGTGWAIGKPGEPVEYIVTNGHVVEAGYMYPKQYANITEESTYTFLRRKMIMWLDRSYTILRPPKRILRLSSFPLQRINGRRSGFAAPPM